MSVERSQHKRWFFEYGFLGTHEDGDDRVVRALEALGYEFVYGGGVGEDTGWQGYPTEFERLVEQLETERLHRKEHQSEHEQAEAHVTDLLEQLETLRTNAIRRFQVIYNESDIDRMKLLAYDGIAEATGNEWRDVRASNPAKERP